MWDTKLMALQFHCTAPPCCILKPLEMGVCRLIIHSSRVEIYELTVYNCFASNLRGLLAIFALRSH